MAKAEVNQQPVDDKLQHIIRLFNTNIDGTKKTAFALTKIKGIGLRMGRNLVVRTNIPLNKRAGELSQEEISRLHDAITDPASVGIPSYMMNHQSDYADGKDYHLVGLKLDTDFRMSLERRKKVKEIRALRLDAGLRVRGQRTKSNGRRGKRTKTHKKK